MSTTYANFLVWFGSRANPKKEKEVENWFKEQNSGKQLGLL